MNEITIEKLQAIFDTGNVEFVGRDNVRQTPLVEVLDDGIWVGYHVAPDCKDEWFDFDKLGDTMDEALHMAHELTDTPQEVISTDSDHDAR